jgi:hypothetical protein
MSDPVIIGLGGEAGSGKSTLANILVTRYGFTRMAFADPLKDMLRVILIEFGYQPDHAMRWIDGEFKEVPCPALDGKSCREALQKLGTEWGRDQISQKLWINLLMARLDGLDASVTHVVVDDVRMDNEADALLAYSWSPCGIYRMVPKGDPRRHPPRHRSEVGVSSHLISGDIVHDYTMQALEAELQAKIVTPFHLKPTGAWSHG